MHLVNAAKKVDSYTLHNLRLMLGILVYSEMYATTILAFYTTRNLELTVLTWTISVHHQYMQFVWKAKLLIALWEED